MTITQIKQRKYNKKTLLKVSLSFSDRFIPILFRLLLTSFPVDVFPSLYFSSEKTLQTKVNDLGLI
jgi:hypothetical protein